MRGLTRGICLGLAGVVTCCGVVAGTQPRVLDGAPHFVFGATPLEREAPGNTVKVRITYPAHYQLSHGSRAVIQIIVPKELTVISGTLSRETVAGVDTISPPWFVELSGEQPGQYRIVGSMTLRCADHVDEAEWELPVKVDRRGLTAGLCRDLRLERVDGAGRYRYGIRAMVPIEGPEPFSQYYIEEHGTKPRPVHTVAAQCHTCSLATPILARCLVVVDKSGRVVSASAQALLESPPRVQEGAEQPLEVDGELDAALREAAETAARQWRFVPARVGSRIISDWTGVEIVVR